MGPTSLRNMIPFRDAIKERFWEGRVEPAKRESGTIKFVDKAFYQLLESRKAVWRQIRTVTRSEVCPKLHHEAVEYSFLYPTKRKDNRPLTHNTVPHC